MKQCAVTDAMVSGTSTPKSCVTSAANRIPVSGERIVPPRIAPMLMSAQKPVPANGRKWPSSAPSAPPSISSGDSTPPEVPEPSENAQIAHLTATSVRIAGTASRPFSRSPIES